MFQLLGYLFPFCSQQTFPHHYGFVTSNTLLVLSLNFIAQQMPLLSLILNW